MQMRMIINNINKAFRVSRSEEAGCVVCRLFCEGIAGNPALNNRGMQAARLLGLRV